MHFYFCPFSVAVLLRRTSILNLANGYMTKKEQKITKHNKLAEADVIANEANTCWYYSDLVKDHFFHPRNFLKRDPEPAEFDAEGEVGNFKCGDIMRMWIKVEPKTKKIKKLKWRTWGCATAIAATSMFSEMVLEDGGKTIEEALKITPQDVVRRLGGVPDRKVHCSVMAHLAFRKAAENFQKLRRERSERL